MKRGVAAILDPMAVVLRIKITNAQRAMERTVGRHRLDIGNEANKRRIGFEDHVELTHFVALHAVWTLRIDLVPLHVTVDAFDHRARTFQVTEPVLSVRRAQSSDVLFDKGLEDAVDVRANGFAISSAVFLYIRGRNVWANRGH